MLKLKVKGMNAIFDFHIHVSVGDTMILAVGSGTATYVEALPPPQILEVPEREPPVVRPSLPL